jgi:putative intracellular protease/amidase
MTMNKEIICILLPKYADWEGAFIASSLNNTTGLDGEMFQVKTMSLTKDPVESIGGFKTIPDYDINTLPDKYEALLLIGGMSWFTEEAKLIVPIVKSAIKNKILVAGICNASVFLGKYGFLNEVKHTSNTLEYLKKSAEKVTREKLITSISRLSVTGI